VPLSSSVFSTFFGCFKTTDVSPQCFVFMEGTLFTNVLNVVLDVSLLYVISMEMTLREERKLRVFENREE